MSGPGVLNSYWQEARSWDADRQMLKQSQALSWRVALAGWFCAVCAAVALVLLMPLKRVETVVVRVDSSTGVVDVVPTYQGGAPVDEAVTRYFLAHYTTTCERFNFATAESDYEECGSFQTAQRNQAWYALWTPSNPASPLNIHKDGSTVRIQVESVTFFSRSSGVKDLAQVRYLKAQRSSGASDDTVSHWIATLQYAYTNPAKDPKLRRWNPLGFKVVDFRTEPEVVDEKPARSEMLRESAREDRR